MAGVRPGRVVVVGSLNLDLTVRTERFPLPGETVTGAELVTAPGGKGANQAVAAALLGSEVALIGAVGADDHGAALLAAAERAAVDTSGVRRLAGHATGSALIVVDAAGENIIIVSPGANAMVGPDAVTPAGLGGRDVVCLSLEIPPDAVLAAAQAGRRAGALVLLNLSPFRRVPADLLAVVDVLLLNAGEAARLLGVDRLPEDPRQWPGLGVPLAVVTLGGEGAVVVATGDGGDRELTPIAPTAVEVVDTTGCGDAFTGALAHQLAGGATLVQAARFATRIGALAATRPGAQASYAAFATSGR